MEIPNEWYFVREEKEYLVFWHKILNIYVFFKKPTGEE